MAEVEGELQGVIPLQVGQFWKAATIGAPLLFGPRELIFLALLAGAVARAFSFRPSTLHIVLPTELLALEGIVMHMGGEPIGAWVQLVRYLIGEMAMGEPVRFGVYSGDAFLVERTLRRRLAALGEVERIVLWGDEVGAAEVLDALGTPLLFQGAGLRSVVVRRADPLAGDQRLTQALRGGPPDGVAVFFVGEEIKGPLATAADEYIHFKKPTKAELRELAVELMREAGLRVHGFVVDLLAEACGGDAMRLAKEVEKLALWKGGKLRREAIPELFYFAEPAPFGFLEGIGWRDALGALRELTQLLKRGWDPQRIFFLLVSQVRALILARAAQDGEPIPEGPDWLWRRRLQQARNFTKKELLEYFSFLQELDLAIKQGRMDPESALYLFTLRLALESP